MTLLGFSLNLLSMLVFLLPLFFTTLTPEFYATNKQALLFAFGPLLFLLWTINTIQNKRITFQRNRLNLPVFLLLASFVFATLISSSNKI